MNRRPALTLAATATILTSGLLPGGFNPASAANQPEPDPGAGQPDDGVVPAEVRAELAALDAEEATTSVEVPVPTPLQMLQSTGKVLPPEPVGGPVLLHGTISGSGAGGGELQVFLTDESNGPLGVAVTMSPIATVALPSSGAFSASPQLTDRIAAQIQDSGALNLTIAGSFRGKSFSTQVVRYYDSAGALWRDSGSTANPAVALAASTPVEPLTVVSSASVPKTTCSSYTTKKYVVNSIVTEVHTSSLFTGNFEYGTRADSELGVEFKPSGGGWSVNGTKAVSRSVAASNSVPLNKNEHRYLYGGFEYHDVFHTCVTPSAVSSWETAEPYAWAGGIARGKSLGTKYCGGNDWNYRQRVEAGATFKRTTGKAQTWSGALSVHGIGLTARSGFSTSVSQTWKAGKASFVCGNGQYPAYSKRVFTSNTQA